MADPAAEHGKPFHSPEYYQRLAGEPRLTPEAAWDELVNMDDRTSPEEYPDMCLITMEELRSFMERGRG